MKKCDGKADCYVSSDEMNCTGYSRIYVIYVQLKSFSSTHRFHYYFQVIHERSLNTTSFVIFCWIAVPVRIPALDINQQRVAEQHQL
jgi:hypothetical protein